jgi:hypothetical protein
MKIFAVSIILALQSCSVINTVKIISKQKYLFKKNGSMPFEVIENRIAVKCIVKGKSQDFFFDSGFTNSAIIDSGLLNQMANAKEIMYKTAVTAKGDAMTVSQFVADSITSEIVSAYNKLLVYVPIAMYKHNCQEREKYKGVFGIDLLKDYKSGLVVLDFANNLLTTDTMGSTNLIGYNLVSSKIKRLPYRVMIPLQINDNVIDFLFDTGNSGGLVVEDTIKGCSSFIDVESEMLVASGRFNSKSRIYSQQKVSFCNEVLDNLTIKQTKLHTNNMGMDFIKYYNWAFDFDNNKVYAKRNKTALPDNKFELCKTPKVGYYEGDLKIIYMPISYTSEFKLGDVIKSVNGVAVDSKNICELIQSVNQNQKWNDLVFELEKK